MSQNLELRPRKCIFLGRSIFITDIILELPMHDDILKIKFQLVLLVFNFFYRPCIPLLPVSGSFQRSISTLYLQVGRYTGGDFYFS